jgi:adenosylhomocysteine nucleosidase
LRDADPRRQFPAAVAADVGVVFAIPMEAGYLLDQLEYVRRFDARSFSVTEGELENRVVSVIVAGVGPNSIRRGVEHLVAGHRPRVLVSAGFAGALDTGLGRNDLVAARTVLDGSGAEIDVDEALLAGLPPAVKPGRLLLVDHVVTATREKHELRRAYQADVIDMETFAVAAFARDRNLPFVSLRVVSDDARSELPPEIGRLLNASGGYRVGAALRAIWHRPSSVKDFWTLHAQGMESADRLAKGLRLLIRGLP